MRHRLSSPALVGRAEELGVLTATLDALPATSAMTVLIGGEAGIGKTRLVDEFGERARRQGALVARGACVPIDGAGLPYGPVVGLLRDVARQSPAAAALVDALGVAGTGAPSPVPLAARQVADELAKTRLFAAILSCFTTLAERSPVVLVLEDLQWADSASAELLDFLTRNVSDGPVLVVGTYRSEDVGPDHRLRSWLGELSRHPRVTTVSLDGLDRDEMATMVEAILGHRPDAELVERVLTRSQGNPFFAEELIAARDRESVSAEFRAVVMARLERQSNEARQVLRAVAVAAVATDHQLLVDLDLLADDALDAAVGEAVEGQVLVVDPTGGGYQFRHELLRELVYEATLPGERRRLHRLIATAITADPALGVDGAAHRAAELAAHWWAAGAWAEALATSLAAADAASRLWAFPEAHTHLERALAALDRLPAGAVPTVDRLQLFEHAADVAYLAGEGERSVELVRGAIDGAATAVDPATMARRYLMLGRNEWAVGDADLSFEAYRQAASFVPAEPPSIDLVRILAEEARGLMLMSRFSAAEQRCQHVLPLAVALGDRAVEGHILSTLGCCLGALGHHDEALATVGEALVIAEEQADPEALDRAYGNLSHLLMEAGRLEECVALVFETADPDEELWGVRLNGATANTVESLIRLGRFDEASAVLGETGERAAGTCGTTRPLLRAMVAMRRGRRDHAGELLARTEVLTATFTDVQRRAAYHLRAAELGLLEGRPDLAYQHVERALALAAGTDDETYRPEMWATAVRCLADQVDDARARGRRIDVDKARLLALAFEQDATRMAAAAGRRGGLCPPRHQAFAATCAAERSRLHGSDPERWEEAARRWEAAGEPYPAAYCRWREAEALLEQRAGRTRAGDRLQEAWQASVAMGADPLREQIERLAQRARIPLATADLVPTTSTVADDLGLTRREVEVLGQLAAGRTDREIADLLFISKKTVSVHVSNLLRKLEVTNRVEAGRVGQAHGCA
jgi:DNA-binding CsgD family transcriptional regulator/tetratricopeptide (TPR) repeat protein